MYLGRVEDDVIEHFQRFLPRDKQQNSFFGGLVTREGDEMPWTNRYRVNVLDCPLFLVQ